MDANHCGVTIDADRLWESLMALAKIGAYRCERTGLWGVNRLALSDADADGCAVKSCQLLLSSSGRLGSWRPSRANEDGSANPGLLC